MKKFLKILFTSLIVSAVAVMFSGCSEKSESGSTFGFKDDLGRDVSVSSYEKTAPLLGSFADIWMLAGGTVCASADDAWIDFELDLPENAVNLGQIASLNLELLFDAEPDFVMASAGNKQQLEWKDTLEAAGIPVAYFDVSSFDDYLRMLKICTDITERDDLYEKYGESIKEQVEAVRKHSEERIAKTGKPSVLFMRASAASIRAKNSKGSVLGEMLSDLGCINIADSDESLLENLSIEAILTANPDKIFFVQSGDDAEGMKKNIDSMFSENPAWYELDAVKNNKVYYMDKHLYNLKPNARWGEAYEQLEKILSE